MKPPQTSMAGPVIWLFAKPMTRRRYGETAESIAHHAEIVNWILWITSKTSVRSLHHQRWF